MSSDSRFSVPSRQNWITKTTQAPCLGHFLVNNFLLMTSAAIMLPFYKLLLGKEGSSLVFNSHCLSWYSQLCSPDRMSWKWSAFC